MSTKPEKYSYTPDDLKAALKDKGIGNDRIQRGSAGLPKLEAPAPVVLTLRASNALEYLRPADSTDPGEAGLSSFELFCRRTGYEPGQVIEFPLTAAVPNPYGPRRFYAEDMLKELEEHLRENGQLVPVHVAPDLAHGTFVFCDGERRRRALSNAGIKMVKAIVIDRPGPKELYQTAFDLNHERAHQTVFDDAVAWKALLDDDIMPLDELRKMVGSRKANFSKTLALSVLPMTVFDGMVARPETFGLTIAYEVSLYFKETDEKQTLAFVKQIHDEGLGYRDVLRLREALRAGEPAPVVTPTKQKRMRYQHVYPLTFRGAKQGDLKTYEDGRVEVKVRNLKGPDRQRFVDALQKLLETL